MAEKYSFLRGANLKTLQTKKLKKDFKLILRNLFLSLSCQVCPGCVQQLEDKGYCWLMVLSATNLARTCVLLQFICIQSTTVYPAIMETETPGGICTEHGEIDDNVESGKVLQG